MTTETVCTNYQIFFSKKNKKNNINLLSLEFAPNVLKRVHFRILNMICLGGDRTRSYNFDPLKPHFYIVKVVFTGYTLVFRFLLININCGYSLESPHRGGSNKYPQSMF